MPEISGMQYEFELVVSDSYSSSEPDTVTVSVFPDMVWPLNGSKGDYLPLKYFGFGKDWIDHTKCGGQWKKHVGVDLAVSAGQPVYAVANGVVKATPYLGPGRGHAVIIEHLGFLSTPRLDFITQYLHVEPDIFEGEVKRGDQIGTITDTTFDHLHFGIRVGTYDSSRRVYDGIETHLAHRGALPVEHGDSNFDGEGHLTGCKSDPLFPGQFIDPFLLDY